MVDPKELAEAIQHMTRRQELYRVLKAELSKRGYWRELPRGDPKKGFQASKKAQRILTRG